MTERILIPASLHDLGPYKGLRYFAFVWSWRSMIISPGSTLYSNYAQAVSVSSAVFLKGNLRRLLRKYIANSIHLLLRQEWGR